jgi:hypothetical protein
LLGSPPRFFFFFFSYNPCLIIELKKERKKERKKEKKQLSCRIQLFLCVMDLKFGLVFFHHNCLAKFGKSFHSCSHP